jgi:hypothetical protein
LADGIGLPRATLKLLARRGDPFAKLLIDNSQPDNVYHLVEQIRRRGRISAVVGGGRVTAEAQIVRDVLRDGRFRTVKPRDRSQQIGRFSPETFEAQWLDGAVGPAVGTKFRGHVKRHEKGPIYWTACTVTECDPGGYLD